MVETNVMCATCKRAHNGVNGRYCNELKQYVERSTTPPCGMLKKDHEL